MPPFVATDMIWERVVVWGNIIQAPWAGGPHLWTGGGRGHSRHSAHGEKLAVHPPLATFLLLCAALLALVSSPVHQILTLLFYSVLPGPLELSLPGLKLRPQS